MAVCVKCKKKLNTELQTLCDSCYLESVGLSESDIRDEASGCYVEGLNTPLDTDVLLFGKGLKEVENNE